MGGNNQSCLTIWADICKICRICICSVVKVPILLFTILALAHIKTTQSYDNISMGYLSNANRH